MTTGRINQIAVRCPIDQRRTGALVPSLGRRVRQSWLSSILGTTDRPSHGDPSQRREYIFPTSCCHLRSGPGWPFMLYLRIPDVLQPTGSRLRPREKLQASTPHQNTLSCLSHQAHSGSTPFRNDSLPDNRQTVS